MAAINFPNPGTQTPPNTFSPSSTPAKTVNGLTYVWNGVGWRIRSTQGEGGGTKVIISEQAPGDAFAGDLWWDSGEPASLFIYYIDEDSKQWVPATPVTSGWYVNGGDLVTSQSGIKVKVSDLEASRVTAIGGIGDTTIRTLDDNGNQVFRAYSDGGVWIGDATGAGNIQLNGNGTATFAGDITAAGEVFSTKYFDADNRTRAGLAESQKGRWVFNPGGVTTVGSYSDYSSGSENQVITLGRNGSITAAGSIVSGNDPDETTSGAKLTQAGQFKCRRDGGTANNSCFLALNGGSNANSNATVRINFDGSATFDGTVTANGSVLTRASGNMNVGDELENAKNALTAIKAAVSDGSTDLSGLKAAILAALVNH